MGIVVQQLYQAK